MTLPASVVAAEKFVEEFYKKPDGNTETPAPAEGDAANKNAATGEGEGQPAATNEPAPAPAPVEDENSETWKHKYDVLNGKFKAEVPVLNSKVREMEARIAELTATQERAVAGSKAAEDAGKKKETLEAALNKLKEEYGEEFIEHSRALARMEAEEILKPLQEKIEGVTSVSQRLAEEQYIKTLTDKAPKWAEIKDNPEFHSWLAQPDEFSGMRRFDLAKQAMLNGDAGRVAAFYNAFSKETGIGVGTATPPPAAPAPPKGAAERNKLVAPASAPTGATQRVAGNEGEAVMVKSSDLARFARDVIAGRYVGREAEMKALEARYNAAQAAGKIVMD